MKYRWPWRFLERSWNGAKLQDIAAWSQSMTTIVWDMPFTDPLRAPVPDGIFIGWPLARIFREKDWDLK